jgi:hypothetical protein
MVELEPSVDKTSNAYNEHDLKNIQWYNNAADTFASPYLNLNVNSFV